MTTDQTDRAALKSSLREAALAARDALDLDERLDWDQALAARALALLDGILPTMSEPVVSAYWPMRSEVDPRPILEGLHERGVALALPALVENRMIFRRWAPYEPIVPGGFGTLVPSPEEPRVKPTIVLSPLAAFDRRGYRIGYGMGHFDAALSALRPVAAIGLAYAAQEIEAVPEEPHDERLAWVVTEREAFRCG